ncbi:ribosomal protein S18 acetylase RimI-like enzyme [Paenibacillus sp. 4624]|jgi:ribosomal protein S18 acetylase RimI-like enzyme|uniref:GNAT family N-acetyltransferase n=1 Tax=Paenibacillus amylolyticus TaxID=1451 RepID=A0A5M9WMU6_PAEAM|nr:GNAT family N-acetyltransferase [Paenibacillus amylolyticus]KAA8782900.1 GNAT family N-acetyltransferase [Paenibacillus amylolyticus]
MDEFKIRQATQEDREQLANLRALVLYDDLTRLGRYDEIRVRERFRNTFQPEHTQVLELEGALIGCVSLKPADGEFLLEHFYIDQDYQGRKLGTKVLNMLLEQESVKGRRVTLNVLKGSPAKRLYERFGFTVDDEDEVDVFMSRAYQGIETSNS